MWYKKSNVLIYSMDNGSLLAHQLFTIGMRAAYVDEYGRVNSVVYGSDIKKILNLKSNSIYKRIRALCDKDSNESILNWQVCSKDYENGQCKMFNVVDEAKFENGKLTMTYNKLLTNLFVNLENNFTSISVEEVMKLRTIEALRLYELLKADHSIKMRRKKLGDPYKATYNITELKILLGTIDFSVYHLIKDDLGKDYPNYRLISERVQNTGLDKRKSYSYFNQSVLRKAVNEINERTSLNVEYTPMKVGNVVVGVDFLTSSKKIETPLLRGEKNMYAIVEKDKDICVGTVSHEPNPFLYLVFVMGICNIDDKEELFSSMVKAEDIALALDMGLTDVCNEMRKISNRSLDKVSIYDWMTREEIIPGKRVLEQIVTDATYRDGIITMRYNHSLNKYLVRLKGYYMERINDLMVDARNETKKIIDI